MVKALKAAVILVIASMALVSCKREFKCACTTTTKINDSVASVNMTKENYHTTRNKAKNWCSSWTNTSISGRDTTIRDTKCMFE